jgi:hypothetical protein
MSGCPGAAASGCGGIFGIFVTQRNRADTLHGRHCTAYLTKRHRIAIYHDDAQQLYQFDTFADLTAPRSGWSETGDVETAALIAAVADALGEEHVTELDI